MSGFCTDISFLTARNIVFKTDLIGFPIAQYLFAESNYIVTNSIDFVKNTLFKPGFALFSSAQSTDVTTPTLSDPYIAKAYFNGARCTNDNTSQLPRWYQLNVPAAPTLIDTAIEYSVTQLGSRFINYQTILICNQGTIAGESNARDGLNGDEEN